MIKNTNILLPKILRYRKCLVGVDSLRVVRDISYNLGTDAKNEGG